VGATTAVNATDWLTAEGFGVELRVVVVVDATTTCETVAGVPAEKFPSPL
jgi:hypothetical protein